MLHKIKINFLLPTGPRTLKRISRFLTSRNIRHYRTRGHDNWQTVYIVLKD